MAVRFIKKRDGSLATFDSYKITNAVSKAARSVRLQDYEKVASDISAEVIKTLNSRYNGNYPTISEIDRIIIEKSGEMGYELISSSYKSYNEERDEVRKTLSIMKKTENADTTDTALLIESDSKYTQSVWDRSKVIVQLQREASLSYELAVNISKKVENLIVGLYKNGIRRLNTGNIRGLVDIVLTQEGLESERKKQGAIMIPKKDLEKALLGQSRENSNVSTNNPEAVNLFIAEQGLKQYGLDDVFSQEVKEAHLDGRIHLHDLGYIDRVYCSSHSLEYIKKYGLNKVLSNLESKSNSPNSAAVLNQHVQTFLASMQANYAGALGFGFLNILYAPLLNRPVEVITGEVDGKEWRLEKKSLEELIEQGSLCISENKDKEEIGRRIKKKEIMIKKGYANEISDVIGAIRELKGAGKEIKLIIEKGGNGIRFEMYSPSQIYEDNPRGLIAEGLFRQKYLEQKILEAEEFIKNRKKYENFKRLEKICDELKEDRDDILCGELINEEIIESLASLEKDKENLMSAPYFKEKSRKKVLRELSYKEFKQIAQNLIFASSQNAFSRGGQTLFIDFNVHTGIPAYLKEVPAIGPGGSYMIQMPDGTIEMKEEVPRYANKEDNNDPSNGDADSSGLEGKILTYGDFEKTSQKFARALLDVWREGDKDGRPFHFPKCDLHIDTNSFGDSEQEKIVDYASQIASENGSVYFMFDRGDGAVLAQCCRLKEKITDTSMLKYPERLRFCGFQNVTINLAQAAYRGKTLEKTLEEIEKSMELALEAHLQKKKFIKGFLDTEGSPLRSLGRKSDDGNPYLDLEKATYIVGNIGLNEAVQFLTGEQMHESEGAYKTGLSIISRMYKKIQKFKEKTGLKFTIEETPAESTTRRLAKVDLSRFEEAKKVVKGTDKNPYYTNSIHFSPDAPVSIIDRIVGQSKFHDMIESGAIIHAYVGEKRPDKHSIKQLVKKTLDDTRCSQLVFSPTYTECDICGKIMAGEKELCENDDCSNHSRETLNPETLAPVTRVVGYYSRVNHWNGSQRQIFDDRKKAEGNYAGEEGKDMSWLYHPNGHERIKIMQFGKEGCLTCENLKSNVKKKVEELGLEGKVDFEVHYLNKLEEEGLVKAAMYGVPLDTVPTLVIAKKGEFWKKTTRYAPKTRRTCGDASCNLNLTPQRSDLIRPDEIKENLERMLR